MLLSEYVGDDILVKEERAVKSRKESLWKLAEDLTNAFNLEDLLSHKLFKNTKELNEEGFQRLFTCYNNGINRLNMILYQDVYKTLPRNVKGRRAKNINAYKLQNLQIEVEDNNKKGKEKVVVDDNNSEENITKRQYRKTSEIEKKILEKLLNFNIFPEAEALIALKELQEESTGWDLPRVRRYWTNNNTKKKSSK